METLAKWEKIVFGVAALVITAGSAFGFYLIQGEPVIKSLVASGHNHLLSFAYGGILFGLLLGRIGIAETKKWWLAVWMSLTYLGPVALIYAGLTGKTGFLMYTSPPLEGSFVVLWALMVYFLLFRRGGSIS